MENDPSDHACYIVLARLQDIKFAVHAHPTLSEVLDELFKLAKVSSSVCSGIYDALHSFSFPIKFLNGS